MDKEARITLSVGGTEEVVSKFGRVGGAMQDIGGKLKAFGVDALKVATSIKKIDLADAAKQARAYDETLSRMSGRAGQSVDQLKDRFEGLSRELLVGQAAQADFAKGLGRVTYDARGSLDALKGLGTEALATGRKLDEELSLGEALHNGLGVIGDTTTALGKLREQAELAGIDHVKFKDALTSVGGQLDQVGRQADGTKDRFTAMAAILGKGFGKGGQERLMSGVIGTLQGRALDVERMLGKRILDDQGHIKDPAQTIKDIQGRIFKRLGKGSEGSRRALIASFGAELGSAIFNGDLSGLDAAGAVTGEKGAAKTSAEAAEFRGSEAGQRIDRQVQIQNAELKLADVLNQTNDLLSKFLIDKVGPLGLLATGMVAPALGRGVGGLLGIGGGAAAGAGAGGTMAGAAGAGGAGIGAVALPVAAAFVAPAAAVLLSTRKDSAMGQRKEEGRLGLMGQELGEQAKRKGYIDEEIWRRAGGKEDAEGFKEMIKYLSKIADSLPPDLAQQIADAQARANPTQKSQLEKIVEELKAQNPKP